MASNKRYWKSEEELYNPALKEQLSANEFPVDSESLFTASESLLQSAQTSRRDFLKYLGFSTAAATLAACEAPVIESIPYVTAPDKLVPGIAAYFASLYDDGNDYAAILVKTREGRPIKFEPNKEAGVNSGTNARVQAAVLNLYDSTRLKSPLKDGNEISWEQFDKEIVEGIKKAAETGKIFALVSPTINSPAARSIIEKYRSNYNNFTHVEIDAFPTTRSLDAWEMATGVRKFPFYQLDKADVVVSFGCDFINGIHGQAVESDYAARRVPGPDMSKHIQIEANMTLTGANADKRIKLRASENTAALLSLYNALARKMGVPTGKNVSTSIDADINKIAELLASRKGKSLVLNGYDNKEAEQIAIAINMLLENFGSTISLTKRNNLRAGDDRKFAQLVDNMEKGLVGLVVFAGVNPAYNKVSSERLEKALAKVPVTVCFSDKLHETSRICQYVGALSHVCESWGDGSPSTGVVHFMQPTIHNIYNTRQWQQCLLNWLGIDESYYHYIRSLYAGNDFNELLHDGVYKTDETTSISLVQTPEVLVNVEVPKTSSAIELIVYQKVSLGTGELANNPWLQEMPDPITRASWDNYVTMSRADAEKLGIINRNVSNGALNGSYVSLSVGDRKIDKVPVLIQPGQAEGTIGLAVGYGREGMGRVADGIGVNAHILAGNAHVLTGVEVNKVDGEHEFACVQLHHTMMGRTIVKEVSLEDFINRPAQDNGRGWNEKPKFETYRGPLDSKETSLWDEFDHETGHFWNMSVDLNLCTGCGACVIACHAENNVPVVGKKEVRVSRDMHWLRIDRYYSSDMTEEIAEEQGLSGVKKFALMEVPSDNPQVVFQPVMCQHCNHAPCETVCPVAATTHSSEGLNHMTYNRCIGTRYCANNCPYKVRRFNWFLYNENPEQFELNYAMNDDLGKMVLNPDVTLRSRGVMEKCSFCIQRIQLGKLQAKKEGRKVQDGEIQTACMSACSTGAITFGDVNDPESRIATLKNDERMYHLLEEVGTNPSVFYQVKVRNLV